MAVLVTVIAYALPMVSTGSGDRAGVRAEPLDLTEAFRAHGRRVFRILRRLGVAEASLDDAVQEVFLVAHRRWSSYDPDASMRSWLFGIARRVASHHHRSRQRAKRHETERPHPPTGITPEDDARRAEQG